MKVLIVDDYREIADFVAEYIELKNHETQVLSSAKEAIEELKRSDFDLIISDYNMPEIDGIALRKIILTKSLSNALFVFCTSEPEAVKSQLQEHLYFSIISKSSQNFLQEVDSLLVNVEKAREK